MSAPQNKDHFQTVLVITLGFIGLSYVFGTEVLLYIGIGIGAVGALTSFTAKYISLAWYKLGEVLGLINGTILLTVLFFIFLVPMGMIYRWTKKNALNMKDREATLFKVRDHQFTAKDLQDPW